MPTYAKPIVGVDAVVELTPVAGGTTIILKNSKYKIALKNAIKEAPNTSDGMLRAPGLNDYSGTVEGHTDVSSATSPIENQALPGSIWNAKFYRSLGAATFWSGTIIMGEDLSIETGCDQTEDWSFSFAKQSGPLVTPGGVSF